MRPLRNLGSLLQRRTRRLPELRNPTNSREINPVRNPNDTKQIEPIRNPNYSRQINPVRNGRQTDPNYLRQIDLVRYQNYSTQIDLQSDLVRDPNYSTQELGYVEASEDEDTYRMLEEQLRGGRKVSPSKEERNDPNYFAKYAVEDYNLKKNQQLEFVEMIKSTHKPSSGRLFRVIFKVKDKKDGKFKIFAGDVWYKFWKDSGWLKSFGLRHVG